MKIILAGAGAFGAKHLDAIKVIGNVEVVSLVGRTLEATRAVAQKYGVPHATTELAEALSLPGVEAAILVTPTQLHASQALACMRAGKHVQVEIPLADNWTDAQAVAELQKRTGLVCMVGHTRRFNPSHQWIHNKIMAGDLLTTSATQGHAMRVSDRSRALGAIIGKALAVLDAGSGLIPILVSPR